MEVINFRDTLWKDIPDQDNPAMNYNHYTGVIVRPEECVMIVKGDMPGVACGGFVVVYVPLKGDVIRLGVFWRLVNAVLFAEAYAAADKE